MKRAFLCSMLLALSAAPAMMGKSAPSVTIVLDFMGAHSDRSLAEMKREFGVLLKDSGLKFDWRFRSDAARESFDHLVVVRFKGKCVLEPVGYMYDERGPLAFTHSGDNGLQPFAEVECDKVAATVRTAISGEELANADTLLGRALARVMAHELVHVLANSKAHGKEGIAKTSLSGRELVEPVFRISASDVKRIQIPR